MSCQIFKLSTNEVSSFQTVKQWGVEFSNCQLIRCRVFKLSTNEVSSFQTVNQWSVKFSKRQPMRCRVFQTVNQWGVEFSYCQPMRCRVFQLSTNEVSSFPTVNQCDCVENCQPMWLCGKLSTNLAVWKTVNQCGCVWKTINQCGCVENC